jgi:DHA1 family tetracycline resistance protein-like MFS transporter
MQFSCAGQRKNFYVLVYTYMVDWLGFSLPFPLFAYLSLTPNFLYFSYNDSVLYKMAVIGLLYAFFGVGQLLGNLVFGLFVQKFLNFGCLITSSLLSILGYGLLAFGMVEESLSFLFAGRLMTGIGSGTVLIGQRAVHDLLDPPFKKEGLHILFTAGALAFMLGPWIGGKLSNFSWIHGSGGFIFGSFLSLLQFFLTLLFYKERGFGSSSYSKDALPSFLGQVLLILKQKESKRLYFVLFFFIFGWTNFLIFNSLFLVENFSLAVETLGDFFSFYFLIWFFSFFILIRFFSLEKLRIVSLACLLLGALGIFAFCQNSVFWIFWMIIPILVASSSLSLESLEIRLQQQQNLETPLFFHRSYLFWILSLTLGPIVLAPLCAMQSPLALGIASSSFLIAFLFDAVTLKKGPK